MRAHCDVYPYTAGSTFLHQVLPPWTKEGGVARMVERLRAPEMRQRVRHEIEHGLPGWGNHLEAAGGWHNILIASVANPELRCGRGPAHRRAGRRRRARDPLDYALDLLVADRGATVMVIFLMDEADVRTALSAPFAAIGSDLLGVTSATRARPSARLRHVRARAGLGRARGAVVSARRGGAQDDRPAGGDPRAARPRPASRLAPSPTWCCSIPRASPTRRPTSDPTRLAEGIEYV